MTTYADRTGTRSGFLPPTERQLALLERLLAERELGSYDPDRIRRGVAEGAADRAAVSARIDWLLSRPRRSRVSRAEVPEGMHRVGDRILKVQRAVHGSGNLYANELVRVLADGSWTFVYARGAIRDLSESTRMTLEEAREFGALYGTCCSCGATLTNEESIEAGIGPICRRKFAA